MCYYVLLYIIIVHCCYYKDCFMLFKSKKELEMHQKVSEHRIKIKGNNIDNIHQSKNGQQYICKYCNKILNSKGNLTKHLHKCGYINNNITKIVIYLCQYCNKSFKSKKSLNIHQNEIHLGKYTQYSCSICHRKFKRYTQHIFIPQNIFYIT